MSHLFLESLTTEDEIAVGRIADLCEKFRTEMLLEWCEIVIPR